MLYSHWIHIFKNLFSVWFKALSGTMFLHGGLPSRFLGRNPFFFDERRANAVRGHARPQISMGVGGHPSLWVKLDHVPHVRMFRCTGLPKRKPSSSWPQFHWGVPFFEYHSKLAYSCKCLGIAPLAMLGCTFRYSVRQGCPSRGCLLLGGLLLMVRKTLTDSIPRLRFSTTSQVKIGRI